jgi:putative transcriptional regulator
MAVPTIPPESARRMTRSIPEQVSQPVFARYLNVRKDAVSKWERGERRPDGSSLKLLNLVKAKGLRSIA